MQKKTSFFYFLSRMNIRSVVYILCCLGLYTCATPSPPAGGPVDETPPKVVVKKSTPNFQTNFKPQTIELTFDEWVKLKNANQQVIISPPFEGFEVRLKGKSLIFDLGHKDTLRNNVTYVIQFGESVVDLTEGNPAEDLRFVFSTGSEIDSLELSGEVVDAYTGEPIDKALVLLYENQADSVFRTLRPFYFGRTGENGRFDIYNMRAGSYKVCALLDADANYRFNQVNEPIAFLEEAVLIGKDTSSRLTLQLFQEQIPLQLQETDQSQGVLKLLYNQNPIPLLKNKGTYTDYGQSFEKDTAFIWHQSTLDWTLYLSADTTYYDTIEVDAIKNIATIEKIQLKKMTRKDLNPFPRKIFPIRFSQPIIQLDTTLAHLYADSSLQVLPYEWMIDSTSIQQLNVKYSFKESTAYKWIALPGSITNFFGQTNPDTLEVNWTTDARKNYGNITFRFTTEDASQAYFIKMLKKDKEPIATFQLQGALNYERILNGVPPDDYQLEIILDDNANGRWDTGSYDAKRQAEKVIIRPVEKLRANWDLEVEVELKRR